MFRLEKLDISGFKSFADRTTLAFGEGITAVVGPNGCGKCVDGNTLVTLADGRDVPIRELVETALTDSNGVETLDDGLLTRENPHSIQILSLNPATLRLETRPVTAFIKRETTSQLLRIRTRSGREVTATPYHPLFTLENGRLRTLKAEELKPGVRLALPRRLPVRGGEVNLSPQSVLERFEGDDNIYVPYSESLRAWADEGRERFGQWSKWAAAAHVPAIRLKGLLDHQAIGTDSLLKLARAAELMPPLDGRLKSQGSGQISLPSSFTPDLARFLGLLVAEGRNTNSNQVWFVNADPLVNDEYERLANKLFGVQVHRLHYKPRAEDGLIYSRALGKALERLFDFPINSSSSEKEIPAQLFEADAETQWAFLSGLFEGDAYICVRPLAGRVNPLAYIEFVSASEKLAQQVISLLMRLGVFASLRPKQRYASNTIEKRRRTYYGVLIYGTEQLRYVAQHLSFVGEKKNTLEAMRELTAASNPNYDLVPGVTSIVKESARLAGVKIKANRRDNPKLAAYIENRCEASRGGLLETIDAIKRLGTTPERASEHLDRLSLLAKSDIYWDEIISVEEIEPNEEWVYDLSIAETHNFVAGNIIVHNSNISDSISWVLGEQSAKNLRGAKMEDVIFNGTSDRKPTGMAEVLLTLVAVEDIHEHDQTDPAEEDESKFDQAVENAERAADTARALVEEMTEKEAPAAETQSATQPETQATAPEVGEPEQPLSDENPPADSSASITQNDAATLVVEGSAEQIEEQKSQTKKAERHRSPHMRRRKKLVISAGERITIGRRLYRTGESDYLMNGRTCLLRDIQDLFAGTGLGGAHYAIIEQGRIGQILSSKPLDRRALIEEAAGITKFKSRKRAAELKLESAKQNLTRLNDIISEVERQVNSLKRQAQKARRYRRLREEMRGLQKVVFAADYFRLTEANDRIAAELEEAESLQRQLDQLLAERESEHQAVSAQAREVEDHLTTLREQAASIELEADRTRNRRAFEQQQIEEMTARIQELERDQNAMQERLALLDAETEQRGLDLKSIEDELTAEQSLLLAREGEYQSALAKLREAETEIERLRQQTFIEIGRLERLRNLKANIEDSLHKLELKQSSLNGERARALSRLEEASSQYAQASSEAQESHTRLADLSNSIAQRATNIEELRNRCADLRSQLEATHSERASGDHRLASLEDLDAHHAYYSDAVQHVLSPEQSARINALGTLADFVEVEAQYERLVESLLGRELQSVLVPTIDDALSGVESIKTEELGRGAFLVVGLHGGEGEPDFKPENDFIETESDQRDEEMRAMPNPSFIADESESAQRFELEVLRAIDLLGLRPEIKAIVERAFPDKCSAAIVPDIEAALQLSIENPLRVYVTYEGEQVVNGRLIVTASHTKGTSLLGLKREIKQLRVQTVVLREDEEKQSAELAQVERRLAEIENETETLDRELRQQEKDSATRDTQLESLARDLERARQHVRVVEAEIELAAQEQTEMQSRIEEMAGELQSAEAMEQQVQKALVDAQSAAAEMRANVEKFSEELSSARASVAARAERLHAARSDMRRIAGEAEEFRSRINRNRLELYESHNRIEQLSQSQTEGESATARFETQKATLSSEIERLAASLAEARARADELGGLLSELRQQSSTAHDRRGQIEVERARLESEAEHLTRTCFSELAMSLEDVVTSAQLAAVGGQWAVVSGQQPSVDEQPADDEPLSAESEESESNQLPTAHRPLTTDVDHRPLTADVDAARMRMDEIRVKIDEMGGVNMMALEELEESEERFRFLSEQRRDILDSIGLTEEALTEIKRRSRERFRHAFTHINENFQRMFVELFGGGHGEMILIDEDDILESGIDLIAQPPGKRLQNVLLLSGGEKAMAAISLVLAIFQYHPSPFCILDEVDAPLDEMNVGRFSTKVIEMSRETQFLVITHNKRTMEAARALYGVTMEEPGVSRLVSVKFE